MPNAISGAIEYFFEEGKANLTDCLRIAFDQATRRQVKKIVIFTGLGEGPKIALRDFCSQPCYEGIKIVAVTFPNGKYQDSNISPEDRELFRKNNVPVVRAHLPFDPIDAHFRNHGILGQDLTLIGNALSIFGGSMSLCVQGAVMACDAGEVELGEHVITMTSDTAIVVRAAPTARLLTDLIVREILCKPFSLTIGKKESGILPAEETGPTIEGTVPKPKSSLLSDSSAVEDEDL
jgi:hypothetical protein